MSAGDVSAEARGRGRGALAGKRGTTAPRQPGGPERSAHPAAVTVSPVKKPRCDFAILKRGEIRLVSSAPSCELPVVTSGVCVMSLLFCYRGPGGWKRSMSHPFGMEYLLIVHDDVLSGKRQLQSNEKQDLVCADDI